MNNMQASPPMAQDLPTTRHPIQVAARRAGVSTEVVRIWERRYAVVAPTRSPTGHRLYSDADVERLRLLRLATAGGRRVGEVAELSTAALRRLVAEDGASSVALGEGQRSRAARATCLAAIEALDDRALTAALERALVELSAIEFVERLVTPLMEQVGALWAHGELSPAQEHLASDVLARTLRGVTERLGSMAGGPRLLVAAPIGQRHELGAMTAALAAVLEGWRVVYLGADLPTADLAQAAQRSGAAAISLSLTTHAEESVAALAELRGLLDGSLPILVGGRAAAELPATTFGSTMRRLSDLGALRRALALLASGAGLAPEEEHAAPASQPGARASDPRLGPDGSHLS